jgi:hypothetical protein
MMGGLQTSLVFSQMRSRYPVPMIHGLRISGYRQMVNKLVTLGIGCVARERFLPLFIAGKHF